MIIKFIIDTIDEINDEERKDPQLAGAREAVRAKAKELEAKISELDAKVAELEAQAEMLPAPGAVRRCECGRITYTGLIHCDVCRGRARYCKACGILEQLNIDDNCPACAELSVED